MISQCLEADLAVDFMTRICHLPILVDGEVEHGCLIKLTRIWEMFRDISGQPAKVVI